MSAPRLRRRQYGFSLVELMVSIVIGLLALVFALNMVGGAESTRRTALGGSDEMQNGMVALYALGNDAGTAGFGLNDPIINGCDTVLSDTAGYQLAPALSGTTTVHPLAPVVIEAHGGAPDRVSFYSGNAAGGTPTLVLFDNYTSGNSLTVASSDPSYGFVPNTVIVVAPDQAGGKCALAEVSNAKAASGSTPATVTFAQGSVYRFNSGNLGAGFTGSAARVFNLGPDDKLAFHSWSVANGFLQLQATDGAGGAATTVAEDIVSIKAEYGFDTRVGTAFQPTAAGGMQVAQWSPTMINADGSAVTGDAGDYQRIAAVRLAVVARSKAYDRPAAGAACTATPAPIAVFGSEAPKGVTAVPITLNLAVAGDPVDWRCYRYRVFETIVGIRNTAWRPT